ncbi:MAG: hypothetical protein J5658_12920 [Prevotella sp.]|nr:hypothetical protein [Prevotella sp.]
MLRRRGQGKETFDTGVKCLCSRDKTPFPRIGSGRGLNQQRPLLISAAGGDYIGSGRCVPWIIAELRKDGSGSNGGGSEGSGSGEGGGDNGGGGMTFDEG